MRPSLKTALLSCLALAAPAAAFGADADADTAVAVNELIVTARRQSERALDVPIPLTALSGDSLAKTGAYTLADVQKQVPSLVAFNSNPRNSSVGIRGIGVSTASDGLDTSVGVYVDGVYLGRPGMALADLIDIDQVEVLRGPQGTLFGRNSSAGVLNITTRAPSFQPAAVVEASYGDYNYGQVRLSLTGPLIDDKVAARLTAFTTHRDGVLPNIKTGAAANSVGRSGARLQLLITPSEKFSLRLSGEYSVEDDTCCVSVLKSVLPDSAGAATARTKAALTVLGYTPTASLDYTQNNAPQEMMTDQHAFSAQAKYDLGFADLTSISAYRYWHFHPLQDSDGTPLDIIQVNVAQTKDSQYSQEFRLASKPGRLTWQGGVYLFHQRLRDHYILNQFGYDASAFYTTYLRLANPNAAAVTIAPGSQYIGDTLAVTDSQAVFGQANFKLTDRLTLTAGVRYTHDQRHGITNTSTVGTPYAATSIPFNYDVTVTNANWSYLVSGAYKITDDAMVYVSYSTGYKAAGLNLNAAVSPGIPLVLEPETVGDWEAGLKSSLFHHRVDFNINAFTTRLNGLQANIAPPGVRSYLANVGDIRAKGVEGEVAWHVTDSLDLSANASYNDTRYISYANPPAPVGVVLPAGTVASLTDRPVYEAPKWVVNAAARYELPARGSLRPYIQAQYSYRSSVYGDVQDSPGALIPAYGLVNARLGTKVGERYDVAVWVNNAFDKRYFQTLGSASIVGAAAYGFSGQLGAPRTFGATVRAEF